ncbi:hypothetical protein [Micromonospora sp. CPCC 205558]|uniref:hypothetical protein n=1 Tax=Micromonospora sp. CPCC 205558 TaxID=3122403 RepID=UPI002FF39D2D
MYAGDIATLRALTLECLASGGPSDTMFVYLQQAVLGFNGDKVWGKELDRINDGEVDVQCPACAEDLLVDLQSGDSSIEPGLSAQLARVCTPRRWGWAMSRLRPHSPTCLVG